MCLKGAKLQELNCMDILTALFFPSFTVHREVCYCLGSLLVNDFENYDIFAEWGL